MGRDANLAIKKSEFLIYILKHIIKNKKVSKKFRNIPRLNVFKDITKNINNWIVYLHIYIKIEDELLLHKYLNEEFF